MLNHDVLPYGLACLVSCLFIVSSVQAQIIMDDFEGNGTITWYGDDCGVDPAFSNPFPDGINPSATVLKYTDFGGLYANVRFDISSYIDFSEHTRFSLKVFIPSDGLTGTQSNQVSLKLQDGSLSEPWSTQCEIIKPVVPDQWQVVTFDFASDPFINLDQGSIHPLGRTDFSRVLLQVNGENNTDQVVAYFDDFIFDGTTLGEPISYQLVWSDEFEGNGMIDTSKWFHQTQLPNGTSWYNNEVQHYTGRTVNSYLDNGYLHLVATRESFTDQGQTKSYTSARLNSKFAFTYGRVEVRAKLPFGAGTWPAIWTLGKNIIEPGGYWTDTFGTTGWPACGEIDIMEHWGHNQNYVQSALHIPSSSGATVNHGGVSDPDVSDTFHVYAVEWTPEYMIFSVDDRIHYTYAPDPKNIDNWPFYADQYLLLNVAMIEAIDPGFTESAMVIDYVRVYQEGATSLSENRSLANITVFPNPVRDRLSIETPELIKDAVVKVYAPTGQLLSITPLNELRQQQDWSSYPSGVYQVNITTPSERVTYKVLKQ